MHPLIEGWDTQSGRRAETGKEDFWRRQDPGWVSEVAELVHGGLERRGILDGAVED
jgi:hypothetical protein